MSVYLDDVHSLVGLTLTMVALEGLVIMCYLSQMLLANLNTLLYAKQWRAFELLKFS